MKPLEFYLPHPFRVKSPEDVVSDAGSLGSPLTASMKWGKHLTQPLDPCMIHLATFTHTNQPNLGKYTVHDMDPIGYTYMGIHWSMTFDWKRWKVKTSHSLIYDIIRKEGTCLNTETHRHSSYSFYFSWAWSHWCRCFLLIHYMFWSVSISWSNWKIANLIKSGMTWSQAAQKKLHKNNIFLQDMSLLLHVLYVTCVVFGSQHIQRVTTNM